MQRFFDTIAARALFVMCALTLTTALSHGAESDGQPAVNNAAEGPTWTDGLALLSRGEFSKGDEVIAKFEASMAPDIGEQTDQRLHEWLTAYSKFQENRHEHIDKAYDTYVGWAKEDIARFKEGDQAGKRGWWRLAASDAARAFNYTMDEEAFRQEPWVQEIVDGAVKAAREYETEKEWVDAAMIYARLGDIFPQNAEYRDELKRCQTHIRIELMYTPDTEWEAEVNGIVPEMAVDAFRKIKTEYLKSINFKELTVRGLEQAIRMAQEGSSDVFEAFSDKDVVDEFINRVRVHLKRAKRAEELDVADLIQTLDNVLRINRETGLLPEEVLVYEFVQGALQPLDRFSDMIWPSNLEEFRKHTVGKFCGVGIQIRKAPGDPILVISPLENSPAYQAGIRPGDLITKINGEPAAPFTITGAVREITGREGTTVTLTFERDGKEFDVELVRREIVISTIKGIERVEGKDWNFMLDPDLKIGYARMTNFTDETIEELQTVLTELVDEQGMRGFIFDLRGNPGGTLRAAVEVSNMFLSGHKEIVSTKGRRGEPWRVPSSDESPFTDFPMIVLINSSSASASEIVSGALQVHKRALIVGERSFGKGSVQQVFPVTAARNAQLKLTTSLYYLPNGRCLHREEGAETWGVDPDVKIKLVPKEEFKINELQLRGEILKGKDQKELTSDEVDKLTTYGPSDSDEDESAEEAAETGQAEATTQPADEKEVDADEPQITREDDLEFPENDPQLEAAVLLMRIRLATQAPWPTETTRIAAKTAPPTDG